MNDMSTTARAASARRNRAATLVISLLALLIRLPFFVPRVTDGDALNYAQGALGYYVAHPPGYVGYCLLGMMLNKAVHHIAFSYVLIDLCFAMSATVLVYPLSRRMGLSPRASNWAVALFAVSFCSLDFSVRIATYMVEAFFAAIVAIAGLTAVQRRSRNWALLASATWAIAGAFRPSTTLLLAPLIVYIALRSDRRWLTLAAHLLITVPILFAWSRANSYFLDAQRGFVPSLQPTGVEGQMIMPVYSGFDLSTMRHQRAANPPQQYHWPLAEAVHWVELRLGLSVLPHSRPWPAPSLLHAIRQILFNFAKLAFFLTLSAPVLLLVPVIWFRHGGGARLPNGVMTFCAWWFIPPLLFFTFCHFGVYGYLAVILSGVIAVATGSLIDDASERLSRIKWRPLIVAALSLGTLAIWCFGKPLHGGAKVGEILNLMVLDHTGVANIERAGGTTSTPEVGDAEDISNHYKTLDSDNALLLQMDRDNLFPNAYYKLPPPVGPHS